MICVIQKDLFFFILSGNLYNIKSRVCFGVEFLIIIEIKNINKFIKYIYINCYFQNFDFDWFIQFIFGLCKGFDFQFFQRKEMLYDDLFYFLVNVGNIIWFLLVLYCI